MLIFGKKIGKVVCLHDVLCFRFIYRRRIFDPFFFVLGYIIFGKVFGKIERRPHDMFLVLLFRALHSFLSIHLLSLENL